MSNAKNLATFLQSGGSIAGDANFDSNTLFVDSSANAVGIGTNSPSTSLDIVRNGVQPLRIQSTSGTEAAINMVNTGGNVQLEAHSGNFTIDADAVGIGTTSPTAPLMVNGGATNFPIVVNSTDQYAGIAFADNTTTTNAHVAVYADGNELGFEAGNAERMRIDSSGNVGIGNSSAQTRLFVGDGSGTEGITIYSGTTGEGQLRFADGTSGSALYQGRIEYNHSTSKLLFGAGGTTPIAIDSNGNLGIGTISPQINASYDRTIHVHSVLGSLIKLTDDTSGSGASDGTDLLNYGNDTYLVNRDVGDIIFNITGSNQMRIDSSGNVGIGTSSTTNDAKLIISGTDGKHPIIKVSDGGGNGYTLLADNYTASESQINFGISYSGAGAVISRGVKVSDTTDNVYLSSQGLYATKPTALKLDNDGSFRFLNTNTNATTAVDTAVTLTERMRITSGGRIGINETSPDSMLHIKGDDPTGDGASITLQVDNNNTTDRTGIIRSGNNHSGTTSAISFETVGGVENGEMRFYTRDGSTVQERMRIDSSGRLLIDGNDVASAANGAYVDLRGGDGTSISTYRIGTSTRTHHAFYNGTSSSRSLVGTIQTSGSSTSYNTTSDYRLKENVTDITDGIERVKQLNPSRFNFIADADTTVDGFLAHEVSDIVPEAVSGEKDAMRDEEYEVTPAVLDDDGNVVTEAVMGTRSVPDYQGIDQSKLVPVLTAALQEAIAKIETLETKVATLEGA